MTAKELRDATQAVRLLAKQFAPIMQAAAMLGSVDGHEAELASVENNLAAKKNEHATFVEQTAASRLEAEKSLADVNANIDLANKELTRLTQSIAAMKQLEKDAIASRDEALALTERQQQALTESHVADRQARLDELARAHKEEQDAYQRTIDAHNEFKSKVGAG